MLILTVRATVDLARSRYFFRGLHLAKSSAISFIVQKRTPGCLIT